MKEKKTKQKYIDDGHTVYNMDVDGMPHRIVKNDSGIKLTKAERRAAIAAAFLHFLPILLGVMICFSIAMLVIYLWLHE